MPFNPSDSHVLTARPFRAGLPTWRLAPTLLLGGALLAGCAPAIIGGVALGAATLHDRRPYYVVIDDQQIELSARAVLMNDDRLRTGANIAVSSYNRSVLLTGQVGAVEQARQAATLISRLPKVARVIDELQVGPPLSLADEAEDGYLATRAKLAVGSVDLPDFDATRVKVVTEAGVVYLLGLVTPDEATAVVEKVRYVPGVKRVVKLFEYLSSP